MSQTPETPEKKNKFAISREVQSEFVENVAASMNTLAAKIKGGVVPPQSPTPFCPASGYPYAGANQTKLILATMERGYTDERWLTFHQLQKIKEVHSDLNLKIKKGEKGVTLLRAEDVFFSVGDDGKWTFYAEEDAKKMRQNSGDGPRVQRKTLFYPYTVFNCSQIENFPPKDEPAPAMSAKERNELIENFIACSGVKVEHGHESPKYEPKTDTIQIPNPDKFKTPEEYLSTKLRLAFHATSHKDRENRSLDENGFHEMLRGETFSMLAGARYGLPMPMDGGAWPEKFEGADNRKAFEAAADASRLITLLDQFSHGDQPRAKWFSKQQDWPAMTAANEATMRQLTPPPAEQPAQAMAVRMRA